MHQQTCNQRKRNDLLQKRNVYDIYTHINVHTAEIRLQETISNHSAPVLGLEELASSIGGPSSTCDTADKLSAVSMPWKRDSTGTHCFFVMLANG